MVIGLPDSGKNLVNRDYTIKTISNICFVKRNFIILHRFIKYHLTKHRLYIDGHRKKSTSSSATR